MQSTESYEDTKTDTETFEHSSTKDIDWFRLTWVVMTSLLIFTIGMLGNVTTIYIYTRSKKLRRNKVFEILLAVMDIYALLFPLSIFTYSVYHQTRSLDKIIVLLLEGLAHGYYTTILCSTICRFVAVFHPFKFNMFFEKWRIRFVVTIVVLFVVVTIRTFFVHFVFYLDDSALYLLDLAVLTLLSFSTIFVLFARIIHKLSKMNRVGVAGNNMEMVGRGENVAPPTQTREKHVVAVKTFGAVTACLLISYGIGFVVAAQLLPLSFMYLYYINHICNPFIYFFVNQEFRSSVRRLYRF